MSQTDSHSKCHNQIGVVVEDLGVMKWLQTQAGGRKVKLKGTVHSFGCTRAVYKRRNDTKNEGSCSTPPSYRRCRFLIYNYGPCCVRLQLGGHRLWLPDVFSMLFLLFLSSSWQSLHLSVSSGTPYPHWSVEVPNGIQ